MKPHTSHGERMDQAAQVKSRQDTQQTTAKDIKQNTTQHPSQDKRQGDKSGGGAGVGAGGGDASDADRPDERDHSGTAQRPARAGAASHAHIQGWGADLDRANRPAYPMERTPPRLEGLHWDEVEDQPLRVRVFHSAERPGVTPVFGTSAPPSGLSGRLRAAAYRLSENDLRHWLLLMLADRVNVFEGVAQDLRRGHVPNVFGEMGWKAELKHNPAGLAKKAAVASGVVVVAYWLLKRRRGAPR